MSLISFAPGRPAVTSPARRDHHGRDELRLTAGWLAERWTTVEAFLAAGEGRHRSAANADAHLPASMG
ncbi:hypothetical protein [Streptomyces achromogenes]|uniref:hypothetical protein n=1 Tax=Streptomyces achromogenes TaxID=67255 RepID=UPI0036C9B53B